MTKLFQFNQYTRHDRNVWYSPCQVPVTNDAVIADLEAQYQEHQRQTSSGPRGPVGIVPGVRQPAGKRPAFKTNREPKGRAE
jgi:hypothetical protein